MALKLTLKNGSIHKVFKSQEPSLPVLSLDPFPFFILFYGLIIYPIKSPNHSVVMESRDILKRNISTLLATAHMHHNAASNTFVASYICQKLAPKLGQLQK